MDVKSNPLRDLSKRGSAFMHSFSFGNSLRELIPFGNSLLGIVCGLIIAWIIFVYTRPIPCNASTLLPIYSLNTGDLIFMSGKTYGERVLQCFSECCYNHVGIIVFDGSSRYVLEADIGQGYRSGVRLIPLQEKINRWKGHDTIAIRRMIHPPSRKLLEMIARAIVSDHRRMDEYFFSWFRGVRTNPEVVFCSELVAEIFNVAPSAVSVDPGWLYHDETLPHGEPLFYKRY